MLESDLTTEPFDEREGFLDLVELLPDEHQDDPAGLWDIGEQEGALETLVASLAECRVPVPELARARLAAIAEQWDSWQAVAAPLASCEGEAGDQPLRMVETTERGTALEEELAREIGPGHPLAGLTLVAWFACRHCDDVLIRVYEHEPWYLSFGSTQYAIVRPAWSRAREASPRPETTFFGTPYEAIDALVDRCG